MQFHHTPNDEDLFIIDQIQRWQKDKHGQVTMKEVLWDIRLVDIKPSYALKVTDGSGIPAAVDLAHFQARARELYAPKPVKAHLKQNYISSFPQYDCVDCGQKTARGATFCYLEACKGIYVFQRKNSASFVCPSQTYVNTFLRLTSHLKRRFVGVEVPAGEVTVTMTAAIAKLHGISEYRVERAITTRGNSRSHSAIASFKRDLKQALGRSCNMVCAIQKYIKHGETYRLAMESKDRQVDLVEWMRSGYVPFYLGKVTMESYEVTSLDSFYESFPDPCSYNGPGTHIELCIKREIANQAWLLTQILCPPRGNHFAAVLDNSGVVETTLCVRGQSFEFDYISSAAFTNLFNPPRAWRSYTTLDVLYDSAWDGFRKSPLMRDQMDEAQALLGETSGYSKGSADVKALAAAPQILAQAKLATPKLPPPRPPGRIDPKANTGRSRSRTPTEAHPPPAAGSGIPAAAKLQAKGTPKGPPKGGGRIFQMQQRQHRRDRGPY
jgi:hypothetical protein